MQNELFAHKTKWKPRLYDPKESRPFPLSRSKADMFLKCPRCFYLDLRMGIKIPSGPAFTLNSAVDHLLKKEFDIQRTEGKPHPLMDHYKIDAVPASHKELEIWRDNFKGVRVLHQKSNFELFGAIDDLWLNQKNEYHVVDYKATSTTKEISLDDQWKKWYKKQAEFYQWLLRAKGCEVSDTAYFVFCNAFKDRRAFDGKLEFDVTLVSYQGDDSWIEPTVAEMKKCLDSSNLPDPNPSCEYCNYIEKIQKLS